ncbi:hypothetical protein FACS1894214_3010 [Planctomycetales bacterium]|nr:hypothetical protein FACS1894214_3010 [Planctomycetales bacterium]
MQRLFWILVILNVLLIAAAGFWLPEKIATHFDITGQPNGWMRKIEYITFMGINTLLAVMFCVPLGFLIKVCPPAFINIPNKDYWIQDGNIAQLRAVLSRMWRETECIIMAVPIWLSIEIVYANSKAVPSMGNEIWVFLGLLVIALTAVLIKLLSALRVPKEIMIHCDN